MYVTSYAFLQLRITIAFLNVDMCGQLNFIVISLFSIFIETTAGSPCNFLEYMKCMQSRVAEHQPVNAVRQRRTKLIGGRCSGRNQELKLSIEVAPRLVAELLASNHGHPHKSACKLAPGGLPQPTTSSSGTAGIQRVGAFLITPCQDINLIRNFLVLKI